MAPIDELGLLGVGDLGAFNQSVQQSDPYGIAGRSLAAWTPNTSTWSPTESGITAFTKSFLSGILGNYAQQRSADQLNSVIGILPQLESNPMSVAAPEGVNSDAFAALKGSAVLKNYIGQESKKQTLKDLLKSVIGPAIQNRDMAISDAVKLLSSDDPANSLSSMGAGGDNNHISRLLDSYGITDPTARAGIRTPEEAKNYLLHVQVDQAAKDAADAKIATKKASSDTLLENRIRGELEKTNSKYLQAIDVAALVPSIQSYATATEHSPADDMALIDIGNKIVNPTGVLRAQLVDQWKNAQNPYHKFAGAIDNVLNGGTFDDPGRQQIIKAITNLAQDKLQSGKGFVDNKISIGKNKGIDTTNLISPDYYEELFGGLKGNALTQSIAPIASNYSNPQDYLSAYRAWEAQSAK